MFDVGTLLEDAETKNAALERVEELEENLATVGEIAIGSDGVQGEISPNAQIRRLNNASV